MTSDNLNELALGAWKAAMGNTMTAVKLLRDRTGLGLREAITCIEKAAARVGVQVSHDVVVGDETRELLASFGLPPSREQMKNDPRLAKHRARRARRKVRGSK